MKKLLFLVLVLAVGALAAWWYFSPEASRVTVHEGKISDIKPMVQLCALEVYEDVPVKGTVDTRHLFAKAAVNASISFDLEKLEQREQGDTLFVTLPPEIVEVRESTEPGAYIVIDTWNDEFFGSSNITTAEENSFKAKARENFRKSIYDKGLVRRARSEAVRNLTDMLSAMMNRPVVVSDPTPEGNLN